MTSLARGYLTAAFALLAGTAGFFLGRISLPNPADDADASGRSAGKANRSGDVSAGGGGSAFAGAAGSAQSAGMLPEQRVPWTRERMKSAARQILSAGSVFSGIPRAMRVCSTLEKEDFPMALEVAHSMAEDFDDHEVFQVFVMNRWAELDPRGFADYIQGASAKDPLHFMDEMKEIVLPAWLEQNQSEAVRWAKGIANPEDRKAMMERVIGIIAKTDPDGVLGFARTHAPEMLEGKSLPKSIIEAWKDGAPDDAARRLAAAGDTTELGNVAHRWATKDQSAALQWARELTEPEQRKVALRGVFSCWASKDFDKAFGALLETEDLAQDEGVLEVVLNHWPAKDLASFEARAAALPNGPVRVQGYGVIAHKLASDNPSSAAEWLGKLPVSREKDEALSKFAVAAVEKHGAAAMEWAEVIDNPAKRRETLRTALDQWFRNEPAAAYEWMLTPDALTPEEKQALLRK